MKTDEERRAEACDAAVWISKAADIDMANRLSREVLKRGKITHATACIVATNILSWVLTEKTAPEDFSILYEAVGILLQAAIRSLRDKERRDIQ